MLNSNTINSPDSPTLQKLCAQLRELETPQQWPTEKLDLVAKAGVYSWFVPKELGGQGWSSADIVAGYIELGSACLTTTFIITQRVAALRRICVSSNTSLRDKILPDLITGESAVTVGISHLTTSRQHVKRPVLHAAEAEGGFVVNGFSPWVTGGCGANLIFMGAQLDDGRQILFVVDRDDANISVEPGFDLVALSGSQTGAVRCNELVIGPELVLFGPSENVLAGTGRATGSFQTSALAIGLSKSAIDFIGLEAEKREDLVAKHKALSEQFAEIETRVLQLASGVEVCTNEELRKEANSLVLRATQSALVAAKGSGYVAGPSRWTLVSGSPVLSGVELPASRLACQLM